MSRRVYPIRHALRVGPLAALIGVAMLSAGAGCKKKVIIGNPEEEGRLSRVADKLEQAFGAKALPPADEPSGFAERLAGWQDFRQCAVHTYVARRRAFDKAKQSGKPPTTHHASIGAEAVEECAVQAAIIHDDPSFCERLVVDYPGPNGETGLPALRCWDAMARVRSRPDLCPLIWLPEDGFGRNAECLAVARRDESVCIFAPNPPRCRALVTDSAEPCKVAGAASDCAPAVVFWSGTREKNAKVERPLFDEALVTAPDGLFFKLDVSPEQEKGGTQRFTIPPAQLGLSWPTSGRPPPTAPPTSDLWGAPFPKTAAHITGIAADLALKLAFHPTGPEAELPLQIPGDSAAATLIIVATQGEGQNPRRRCWPANETAGRMYYRVTGTGPGAPIEGRIDADKLACSDGSTAKVRGTFRAVVLDVR